MRFFIRILNTSQKRLIEWHGIGLTLTAVVAIHYFTAEQTLVTPTLALAFIPVAYTAYYGGLWPGLAAALIGSIYPFVAHFPVDRSIQIAISLFAVAWPTGYLQSKARRWDTLNGLRDKAFQADVMVKYMLANLESMTKTTIRLNLETLQDLTGNLATAVSLPTMVKMEIEQALMLAQQEIELKRLWQRMEDENPSD